MSLIEAFFNIHFLLPNLSRQDNTESTKWFGEKKDGKLGFFDGSKTEEVARGCK